jgi:FtsP/CotA-like multicopper oxidase with cupredoxin domain
LDNGLINGTNTYNDSGTTVGSRFETTFVSGTSYRMRLINAAIDTQFDFSIDNHTLTVIAMDFVPITPYTTDVLNIAIAQRYDIIVTANQTSDNYWMRAVPQVTCSNNDNTDDIKGIVRYDSTSTDDPTTTAYTATDNCDGESYSNLVPYLSKTVGSSSSDDDLPVSIATTDSKFYWYINDTSMYLNWSNPTIEYILDNDTTYGNQTNVITFDDTADEWAYFVISTTVGVPHPIHLHGHDFYVLASGTGTYDDTTVTLNTTNPTRRDVTMLPASGYIVIAFLTDNPGAWILHCHIGWHQSEGLALQFIEQESAAYSTFNSTIATDICSTWDDYWLDGSPVYEQDDSGI